MIDEILNGVVKTASELVGGALGYNNHKRREDITNKTESLLNGFIGDFKGFFDDIDKELRF